MFKNFDKVFNFTFRNQVNTKSYKLLTVVVALILLILPGVILYISGSNAEKAEEDSKIEECGASSIYVVDEYAPDADFNFLNRMGTEGYEDIKYVNYQDIDEALQAASEETDVLVVYFDKNDNEIVSHIIIPDGSAISKSDADNLNEFLNDNEALVTVLASGVSIADLNSYSQKSSYDIFTSSGYAKGESVYEDTEASEEMMISSVTSVFNLVITFIVMMVLYFMILSYGNSITQNVIAEKASKLMDTMLISLRPESLVFGKLLGVLAAGFMQFFIWIASLIVGFLGGYHIVKGMGYGAGSDIFVFIEAMGDMGIFKPLNVILAIITVIFGVVLYCALSCMAGAISNNREEAASNQSIFVLVLIASFYVVLFMGLKTSTGVAPTWMMFVPPVAAMVLPSALCVGGISTATGLLALLVMIAVTVILVVIAGRLYKMMALYKGNSVKLGKALKMLLTNS